MNHPLIFTTKYKGKTGRNSAEKGITMNITTSHSFVQSVVETLCSGEKLFTGTHKSDVHRAVHEANIHTHSTLRWLYITATCITLDAHPHFGVHFAITMTLVLWTIRCFVSALVSRRKVTKEDVAQVKSSLDEYAVKRARDLRDQTRWIVIAALLFALTAFFLIFTSPFGESVAETMTLPAALILFTVLVLYGEWRTNIELSQ